MASKNRKCISCSSHYSYCPSCSRVDALAPTWKSEFCSESCMTLWTTLTKYNMEFLTKEEAKDIVSKLELKPIDTYVDCVKRDYAKVMEEDPKPKRGKRIEVQPVDEVVPETVIDEVINAVIDEESHEVVTIENE